MDYSLYDSILALFRILFLITVPFFIAVAVADILFAVVQGFIGAAAPAAQIALRASVIIFTFYFLSSSILHRINEFTLLVYQG
ncbi:MAG: hypothetical protein D6780_02980 [Candidatus Dadabacteria bacterium]|nr:MAG: hypothetical protein D6780_02980 [Candidatus Dadabacteria bacterium]